MTLQFTPREVAELSGVTKGAVEKAIEEKVLTTKQVKMGLRRCRALPVDAVAYLRVLGALKMRMDLRTKRTLFVALRDSKIADWKTLRVELEPAVELDVGRLLGPLADEATWYGQARDRYIVEDEEILGGTPVIRGTRLTVYAVKARLDDGETAADIVADYPDLSVQAIEAAALYAKTHPLVGRPAGRPWSNSA